MTVTCPHCGRTQPTAPVCTGCGALIELGPGPSVLRQAEPRILRLVVAMAMLIAGLIAVAAVLRARLQGQHVPEPAAQTPVAPVAQPAAAAPATALAPATRKTIEAPEPVPAPPPPTSAGGREFPAPGRLLEVIPGGRGRFLVARIASPPFFAVFDVEREAWSSLGFNGGAQARVAADARRVYLTSGEPRYLWSFDLETLEPVTSAPIADLVPRVLTDEERRRRFAEAKAAGISREDVDLSPPPPTPVRLLAAGASSEKQPLLLGLGDDFRLVDPGTLQPMLRHESAALLPALRNLAMLADTHVQAAADGKAFALWRTREGLPGFVLRIDGGRLDVETLASAWRFVVPASGNRRLFTDRGVVEGAQTREPPQGRVQLPSLEGGLVVEVAQAERRVAGVRVLRTDGTELIALPALSEFENPIALDGVPVQQRFFLVEGRGRLLTIPRSDDRVVVRDLVLAP